MADPISMLAVGSAVAGVAGGGLNAIGSYNAAEAQSQNAAYQAQVAANNAKIAQQNANLDLQAGTAALTTRGMKTRAQVGTQTAEQGASGVDVNSGSFVGARKATAEIGALDALTIRSNTARQQYADEVQATNAQAESGLQSMESTEEANAAPLAAAGSLLSSASSVGGSFAKFLQTT